MKKSYTENMKHNKIALFFDLDILTKIENKNVKNNINEFKRFIIIDPENSIKIPQDKTNIQ